MDGVTGRHRAAATTRSGTPQASPLAEAASDQWLLYTVLTSAAATGYRLGVSTKLGRLATGPICAMGLTFENGQLLATTSIAALAPDGQSLRMPPSTEYVLMEIGCSDWDTMDETDLDQHRGRGFLISFEPLLDKYAVLLARGTATTRTRSLFPS